MAELLNRYRRVLRTRGWRGAMQAVAARAVRPYHLARTSRAQTYAAPSADELLCIARELQKHDVAVQDFVISPESLSAFVADHEFPDDYHGGRAGAVWDEKMLEHYVAWSFGDLGAFGGRHAKYLDIAGASSPWVRMLAGRGIDAWCIDLESPVFGEHPRYMRADATKTHFADGSVSACSLQCAFEMFAGDDDQRLVHELARILHTGGRAVISPLYLHTHPCGYSSPEFFGKGYADVNCREYVRPDVWGVPFSRKYCARTLVERVLDSAARSGLEYSVLRLRNGDQLGKNIYLHFVLVLTKRDEKGAS